MNQENEGISKIKLLKLSDLEDGTQRFQSQLLVGKDTADFVMGADGIMKCYGRGDKGFNFYPYNKPYEIVSNKAEMVIQAL